MNFVFVSSTIFAVVDDSLPPLVTTSFTPSIDGKKDFSATVIFTRLDAELAPLVPTGKPVGGSNPLCPPPSISLITYSNISDEPVLFPNGIYTNAPASSPHN